MIENENIASKSLQDMHAQFGWAVAVVERNSASSFFIILLSPLVSILLAATTTK